MRTSSLSRAAIVGALVATLTVVPIQTAMAEPSPATLPYCAVEIFPVGESNHPPAEEVCFATEDEVAEFIAGTSQPDPGARAVAASVAVGTVYKDAGGAGASLTFFGANACAGESFGFPAVQSSWAGTISSVRAASGCWATAYPQANYAGSRVNCPPYCATMGSLNDAVGSLIFRPAGSAGRSTPLALELR
jgi:hypothetical protein